MRNLKRALSLALASIMVLGLMVVGSSAASYTDVTAEHNTEAIEVLQSVSPAVMEGTGDNKFEPEKQLTRNEMAVIMCRLLDYTVASYKGTSNFTDVPVGHWAEEYVAACYTNKIIAGYSDTYYGGDDVVTTGQAGLMLLKALGYFREPGDFGSDWLVETVRIGSQIGLFDGLKNGAREALTRNDAAQICLNALESEMVEIREHDLAQGANGQLTTKAVYAARTSTDSKYGKITNETREAGISKYTIQLGEDLYDGDLRKDTNDRDSFGRPSTKWSFKGTKIGTYADGNDDLLLADKVITARAALITDKDYKGFDETDDFASTIAVYINGDKQDADTTAELSDVTLQAGDVVELFENSNNDIATIAVTRYTAARIKELDKDLSSTYTNRGASVGITLEDLDDSGLGGTYYDAYDNDSAKVLKGYTADYAEGDVLVIAVNGDEEVLSSYAAKSVSGGVTKLDQGSKAKVTMEDGTYPLHTLVKTSSGSYAARSSDVDAAGDNVSSALELNLDDTSYTLYLDSNDYIVGIEEGDSVKLNDVYYVTGLSKSSSLYQPTYYAQAVSLYDGSVTDFKIKDDDADTEAALLSGTTDTDGDGTKWDEVDSALGVPNFDDTNAGLYTFTKDGGAYTVKQFVSKDQTADGTKDKDSTHYVIGSYSAAIGDDLARDDTKMSIGGTRVYLDENTNYVKVERNGKDIDVKTATGGTSVKQNGTDVKAIAVTSKKSGNMIANYVVLISATADFNNASSDDVVFVSGSASKTQKYKTADGDWKTGYLVKLYFMDGSGKVEEDALIKDNVGEGFYTWITNDDGIYELDSGVKNLFTEMSATGSVKHYDDETGWLGSKAGTATKGGKVELTRVYNNMLTMATAGKAEGTVVYDGNDSYGVDKLADLKFAENVIIADDRGSGTRDGDVYKQQITNVTRLKGAIDKGDGYVDTSNSNDVYATVYIDNEEIIMVYVWAVKNDTTTPAPLTPPSTDYSSVVTNTTATGVASLKLDTAEVDGSGKLKLNALTGGKITTQIKEALEKLGYTGVQFTNAAGAAYTISAVDSEGIPSTITCDTKADSSGDVTWYSLITVGTTKKYLASTTTVNGLAINSNDGYSYVKVTTADNDVSYVLNNADTASDTIVNGATYATDKYWKVTVAADAADNSCTGYSSLTTKSTVLDDSKVDDDGNLYVKANDTIGIKITLKCAGDTQIGGTSGIAAVVSATNSASLTGDYTSAKTFSDPSTQTIGSAGLEKTITVTISAGGSTNAATQLTVTLEDGA